MITIIHNQPSHGGMEGEIECWASKDGEQWEKRGNPAPHDPNTVRMNHAAGLAKNGDLIVLCSGWTNEKQPQRPKQRPFRDDILRAWVCRSSDGGRTWSQNKEFPTREAPWSEHIPFGDIFVAEDGSLRASTYQGKFKDETKGTKTESWRSWLFRSDDDGKTWRAVNIIGPRHNETSLFHAGGKRWLAAARIDAVELFASDDDGLTWSAAATRHGEKRNQCTPCQVARRPATAELRQSGQGAIWCTREVEQRRRQNMEPANTASEDAQYGLRISLKRSAK